MPEVNVGSAGVKARFDAQRAFFPAGFFQAGRKLSFVDNVNGVTTKEI